MKPRRPAASWLLSWAALLAMATACGHAQKPAGHLEELGPTVWKPFSAWKLSRAKAPAIDVYVARLEGRRPTVLLLPGSKCLPLFWVLPKRLISPLFLQEAVAPSLGQANFVVFDRRGLKSFGPPPESEEAARKLATCTPEHGGVSKLERVEDAVAVASAVLEQPWVSELWVVGHSEGADVASGVAKLLGKRVSAVALFGGAGITRFFEKSVAARRSGGSAASVKVLEELIDATTESAATRADPELIQARTYGVLSTPLDDLRDQEVPVFVAHGDADEKVPIEAAEAFVSELLRQPTRAVRYLVVPGANHGFIDGSGKDRSEEALRLFLEWARTEPRGRRISVLAP